MINVLNNIMVLINQTIYKLLVIITFFCFVVIFGWFDWYDDIYTFIDIIIFYFIDILIFYCFS